MNLTINVPDEQEAALKARAQAQGLSPEEFAGQVLAHELEASASESVWEALTRQMHSLPDKEEPVRDPKRPIWEVIAERVQALPPEVFERLPEDGASQHDHYIYGLPKREQ
jgi:plasmid stability protein